MDLDVNTSSFASTCSLWFWPSACFLHRCLVGERQCSIVCLVLYIGMLWDFTGFDSAKALGFTSLVPPSAPRLTPS